MNKTDNDNLAKWKSIFGLDDNASEAEVKAAAEEQKAEDPGLYKQFTDALQKGTRSYLAQTKENLAPMQEEVREGMTKDKKALTSMGFETSDSPKHSMQSGYTVGIGPFKTAVDGGADTYTKSPEDWAKEFPPPRDLQEEKPAEEPKDLAAEVEKRVGMKRIKGPTTQGTDKIDAKIGDLFSQAQAYLTSGQMANAQEEDEFAAELKKLRADYSTAKDDIEKRELLHTLADAFTQLGAGYASQATGQDLTNIKTKQRDFGADRKLALEEHQTSLGDLRSRRQEDQQKRRDAMDTTLKKANLELDQARAERDRVHQGNQIEISRFNAETDAAYKDAMVQIYGARDNDKDGSAAYKLWTHWSERQDKGAEDYRKNADLAGEELKKNLFDKNIDDNSKIALVQSTLVNKLGVHPERAQEIASTPGMFWGKNIQKPEQIISAMDTIAAQEYRIKKLGAQLMPGEQLVMDQKTGAMKAAPEGQLPGGYKVVAVGMRRMK